MSSANIGWLFYKDYFKGLNYSDISGKNNEQIIQKKVANIISQTPEIQEPAFLGNAHFRATTSYPGLLLGSGNAHELPSLEGQAILGFSFDYTSGLPLIAGSSIKGVLRSAFKHPEYIKKLLKNQEMDIKALEDEIFNYNDIFFDALIIKSDSFGKVLADDFLTPHSEDATKNPIPLRFIKVPPNVTFVFDFELHDGLIDKRTKLKLFEDILQDLGIGAKTNVGYGKFENIKIFQTQEEEQEAKKLFEEQLKEQQRQREEEEKKARESKKDELTQIAQRAWDEVLKKKGNQKQFKKLLEKFIKKWEAPKNNKGSEAILALVEEAKKI